MVNSSIDSIRLEAREITLGSKRKKRLDNLTFTLEPGHLITIVGGSDAGNSCTCSNTIG